MTQCHPYQSNLEIKVNPKHTGAVVVFCDNIEVARVSALKEGMMIAKYLCENEYSEKRIKIEAAPTGEVCSTSFEAWLLKLEDDFD
ncbi:hypothetical protein [Paraferrimonas sp. SM1919]|uniref:hypothetical protein n=1 Tax=Paraferrimonas sp. SM1919 TaxID=2662263 RepID=UPI0013D11482|nr:hypothetical protein [Paraferrimonas sp. SM1919]